MLAADEVAELSHDAALAELERAGGKKRRWDAYVALLAGRVKQLSDRELGYAGLAQSRGARTAEILVQQVTGLSKGESAAAVRVGSRAEFLDAVRPEELGLAKVDAVRRGLGDVTAAVSGADLRLAAERLALDAPRLSVEDLAAHARAARDELDAENVARREQEQRDARYLSLTQRHDGMYSVHGLLDAESAMVLKAATDAVIAPRRGGPRFVDKVKAEEQEKLGTEDARTVGQMMLDALVDLVHVAVATSDGAELTGGRGHVTIHVVRKGDGTLDTGGIEGHPDAISQATIERHMCNDELLAIGFEHGLPVDTSTDQRLFNRRQRRALAARWGGCAFPGCGRPPSWTEAHHIKPWAEGNHITETADGILLCRHHHQLIHNNGWSILRHGNTYVLQGPDGAATPLESKSPVYRQHQGGTRARQLVGLKG